MGERGAFTKMEEEEESSANNTKSIYKSLENRKMQSSLMFACPELPTTLRLTDSCKQNCTFNTAHRNATLLDGTSRWSAVPWPGQLHTPDSASTPGADEVMGIWRGWKLNNYFSSQYRHRTGGTLSSFAADSRRSGWCTAPTAVLGIRSFRWSLSTVPTNERSISSDWDTFGKGWKDRTYLYAGCGKVGNFKLHLNRRLSLTVLALYAWQAEVSSHKILLAAL